MLANVLKRKVEPGKAPADVLPQYGLLAKVMSTYDGKKDEGVDDLLSPTASNLVNTFSKPVIVKLPKPEKIQRTNAYSSI